VFGMQTGRGINNPSFCRDFTVRVIVLCDKRLT